MKIMVFNGILLFMLFMWTSAEIERDTESKGDLQDQEYDNESRVDILTRARACKNIDGKCIKKNRDCPNNRPLKKNPGSPYCSKQRHCCYPAAGCVFGEKSYSNKAVNEETCLVMQCNNGDWEYTKQIREDCNTCTAAGDPHMYVFDEHCVGGNSCGHQYEIVGQGEYVITQDSISLDSALFGVESHLQKCNGDLLANVTCVQNITYYEPGITVTLTSHDLDLNTSNYCSMVVDPTTDPRCAIKVFVNGEERIIGRSVHSFYATDGTVLVFNHPNIVSDLNRNCVNIVGSKGLSVSLCIHNGVSWNGTYGDFTWLDVSAMPSLESTPSTLYGLCDTNTGATRNNYTMSGGSVTDDLYTFTESWRV